MKGRCGRVRGAFLLLGFETPRPMDFQFDIDCEVFEKADREGRDRKIGGMVSTDSMDRQQEVILQEGLDFGPFLKSGWFNDNHDQATDAVLGYPTHAELRSLPNGGRGWYVEGYLLKGTERADRIFELAKALQKSNRKLGFSVEGKILARDEKNPNIVRRAIVREVAITRCPINQDTALSVLAKSLAGAELAKALTAGSAVAGPDQITPGDGFALRTESLEGAKLPKKKKRKRFEKAEAIALLKSMNPALSDEAAERIFNMALTMPAAAE